MAALKKDTLYYRHDHPHGFKFIAGNAEPDAAEGWVTAAADIAPAPERQFECTTLKAFEELLKQERKAAVKAIERAADAVDRAAMFEAQLTATQNELEVAKAAIQHLSAELKAKGA